METTPAPGKWTALEWRKGFWYRWTLVDEETNKYTFDLLSPQPLPPNL